MFIRIILLLSIPSILLSLLSCSMSAYKVQIHQGNKIDETYISKLTLDMSPQQVMEIVGIPDMQDAFSPNRFDYLYIYQHTDNLYYRMHYYLLFSNDKLIKISPITNKAINIPPTTTNANANGNK